MAWLLLAPLALQAVAMGFDEFYFHRRRRLPRWERVGHPLDTLTLLACWGLIFWAPASPPFFWLYAGLAVFSSLFITKDEFVHARRCPAGEHWLHAVLFVLHPLVLLVSALAWPLFDPPAAVPDYLAPASFVKAGLIVHAAAGVLFLVYQTVYWNWLCPTPADLEA